MGLVLRVMCRCFIEGKTEPPISGPIRIDEDGSLVLDLPLEGNEEHHSLFIQWCESGCEHPRMVYASDVFNWTAYRSFQQALEIAGWQHFPRLRAVLPMSNDGVTSANVAPEVLNELSYFSEEAELGQTTVLVETDTGKELHEYIAAYGGEFHIGQSGDNFGVDEEGFFIRRQLDGMPKEVFRAMRIEQVMPDPNISAVGSQLGVEFVNLDSGFRYVCGEPMVKVVFWPIRLEYPVRMHVITRRREVSDFENVIGPLRTIFEAAIKTGNPIAWS